MSDLKIALLVVGLVAFVVVLVASFDKKQLTRSRRQDIRTRTRDSLWQEPTLTSPSQQEDDNNQSESEDNADNNFEELMEKRKDLRTQNRVVFESTDDNLTDTRTESEHRTVSDNNHLENDRESTTSTFDNIMVEPVNMKASTRSADFKDVNGKVDQTEKMDFTGFSDSNIEIDFVAYLAGKNSINRDTALGLFRQYEFDIARPIRIFGHNTVLQEWTDLTKDADNAQYQDVGMSIQLADQNGPVSESILNKFSQMILRFAEVFGRRFKFSMEFDDALKRAKELDQFAQQYDSLAVINVVARKHPGFSGRGLDYNARELGMDMTPRGIYVTRNQTGVGGAELFSMANLTENGKFDLEGEPDFHSKGVTLFMSIPSTPNPAGVFHELVSTAKELAKRLDGKLVDQSQRGMTQKGIKAISKQIRQIEYDMDRAGIKAGSDLAARLFTH